MAKPKAPKKVSNPGKAPKKGAYPVEAQKKFSERLYYLEQVRQGKVKGKTYTAAHKKEAQALLAKFHKTPEYQKYYKDVKVPYQNALAKYEAKNKAYKSYLVQYAAYEKNLKKYNDAYKTMAGHLGGLSGVERDAAAGMTQMFKNYGLSSLAPKIVDFVKRGYGPETITSLLQETPEYKKRFAGNELRRKKGLAVLSPAEYLSTEAAYKQVMSQAGMPANFYDKPEDFSNWIGGDVSPTEIQKRVNMAAEVAQSNGAWIKTALKQYYGTEVDTAHLAAYVLDQKRALPLLEKQINTAKIGGAAMDAGFRGDSLDRARAEELTALGVTEEEARKGYGVIQGYLPEAARLAKIYGDKYDLRTAENEVLLGFGADQAKRERLASKERAQFEKRSGVAQGSLAQRGGQT